MNDFCIVSVLIIAAICGPCKTLGGSKGIADWSKTEKLGYESGLIQESIARMICYLQCGNNYICNNAQCKCTNGPSVHFNHYAELEDKTAEDNIPLDRERETLGHLALRHHIAHFCPDLETARECIRSCMKLGKPALCGKDHVCYCGHRYTSHDAQKKINKNDIYAEFRDIYEKYFGPQMLQNDHYDDDSEDDKLVKFI